MAKSSQFVCQNCGSTSSKWSGRCDGCGAWNSVVEEQAAAPLSGSKGASLPKGRATRLVGLKGETPAPPRIVTGIGELDRVAGDAVALCECHFAQRRPGVQLAPQDAPLEVVGDTRVGCGAPHPDHARTGVGRERGGGRRAPPPTGSAA